MMKFIFLVLFLFLLVPVYAINNEFNTNSLELSDDPGGELSALEIQALQAVYSNESILRKLYIEATNKGKTRKTIPLILETKNLHLQDLQALFKKYQISPPAFEPDLLKDKPGKDKKWIYGLIKAEMENKNICERFLTQISNDDISAVLKRIRNNSELSFLVLNGTIKY